mgnify:CR=1 FL=1
MLSYCGTRGKYVREVSHEIQEQCAGVSAEAAKRRPGDTAVVDEFGSYTYKQLQDIAQRTAQRYPNTTWQIGAWSSWWKNAMTRLPSCWARCSHPDITCRSIHRFPPCDLRTSSRHWEARSWWPTRKPCGAFNSKTRARSFPWRSCIASAPGYSSATRSSRHRFRSIRHTFCSPPDQRASPKA